MKKFPLIIGIVTFLIVTGGILIFSKENKKLETITLPSNLEFFWLEGCSHCENVEEFINSWDKKDQIKIDKLEAQINKQNGLKLISVGKYCKIDNQLLGSVPLLFTPEGKCFLGDEPIINYLKTL